METREYRIKELRQSDCGAHSFAVQVKGIVWHTVKTYASADREYARMLAEELLEMLQSGY